MTIFLLNITSPFVAQATFPGENIIFGKRGQSGEEKDKDFAKVLELAKQKKYEQALTLINQKIKKSSGLATPYIIKGFLLNELRQYIRAEKALSQGQMIEGRHPGIQYGYCEVYRNLGMSKLSLRACEVAEGMHMLSPEAHYEYAQILIATGEMVLANQALSTAAKLAPNNTQYHYEIGMNFYYLNQYDDAESSFQKALSIDPTNVDAGYQLAYIYAARKKGPLAKTQIEKVLQVRKKHRHMQSAKLLLDYVNKNAMEKLPLQIIPHEYHTNRSKSLYQLGQYGLALIEIETAAKLKPDDLKIKEIVIGLTGFLLRINKTEKVVKEMISIVGETDINAAKGYQELGDIEIIRGNLSKARTYYEKVLKLSDPNGIARQTLSEIPEQKSLSRTTLGNNEIFIEPSKALNRKGELFAQHKMFKRAIAIYSLASRIKPSHLPTLLNTATTYYNSGNYGKSISILERLLISHPHHENILAHRILLAQAYVKSDNRGKGLKNIAIAISLNPDAQKTIRENPVFEPLRNMDEYKKIIQ